MRAIWGKRRSRLLAGGSLSRWGRNRGGPSRCPGGRRSYRRPACSRKWGRRPTFGATRLRAPLRRTLPGRSCRRRRPARADRCGCPRCGARCWARNCSIVSPRSTIVSVVPSAVALRKELPCAAACSSRPGLHLSPLTVGVVLMAAPMGRSRRGERRGRRATLPGDAAAGAARGGGRRAVVQAAAGAEVEVALAQRGDHGSVSVRRPRPGSTNTAKLRRSGFVLIAATRHGRSGSELRPGRAVSPLYAGA